jgi:hypothetical protein
MRDHPIIFSAPMVRALLAGRKSQTRRLASSPLRRVQAGDRLWVRENFYQYGGPIEYAADGPPSFQRKLTPSIHMPRWASRLTLKVSDVRFQRLQRISRDDAIAEGIEPFDGPLGGWTDYFDLRQPIGDPIDSYCTLWASLHGAESWNADPQIVALTFEVIKANIDQCPI